MRKQKMNTMHEGLQLFSIGATKTQITAPYAPVNLAVFDGFAIRLVKFQGEFERWHAHENEAETFIVLEGAITFQTEIGDFHLTPGQGITIPKGLRHCPCANETGPMPLALILEKVETKRLGDG